MRKRKQMQLNVFYYRGIGLMVAKRLLSEVSSPSKPVRLCLACRSIEKAKATRKELLRAHPFAHIDVLEVDTSIPESAKNAAQELMKRCILF